MLAAGHPVVLRAKSEAFATTLWARRYRFELPTGTDPDHDRLFNCTLRSCAPLPANPVRLGLWAGRKPPKAAAFEQLCQTSDVLALRSPLPDGAACPGKAVLTADDFARNGAVEMRRTAGGWSYRWTAAQRGRRPWTVGAELNDSDG